MISIIAGCILGVVSLALFILNMYGEGAIVFIFSTACLYIGVDHLHKGKEDV